MKQPALTLEMTIQEGLTELSTNWHSQIRRDANRADVRLPSFACRPRMARASRADAIFCCIGEPTNRINTPRVVSLRFSYSKRWRIYIVLPGKLQALEQ